MFRISVLLVDCKIFDSAVFCSATRLFALALADDVLPENGESGDPIDESGDMRSFEDALTEEFGLEEAVVVVVVEILREDEFLDSGLDMASFLFLSFLLR